MSKLMFHAKNTILSCFPPRVLIGVNINNYTHCDKQMGSARLLNSIDKLMINFLYQFGHLIFYDNAFKPQASATRTPGIELK